MAAREWVETASSTSSWPEIRNLSWHRSGGERRLFCFRFQWSSLTLFVDFTSIMATFREIRDLLAVACFEDIDEDEFLLLWDLNTSKNLDFPYEDYGRFDLDEMDDSECLATKVTGLCLLPFFCYLFHQDIHLTIFDVNSTQFRLMFSFRLEFVQ